MKKKNVIVFAAVLFVAMVAFAASVTKTFTLIVDPATLDIGISSLAHAQVGVPYSVVFPGVGGVAPYTCAISSGTLPPGLSMTTSTCTLSGTPATGSQGTYTFGVTLTDSQGTTANATVNTTIK